MSWPKLPRLNPCLPCVVGNPMENPRGSGPWVVWHKDSCARVRNGKDQEKTLLDAGYNRVASLIKEIGPEFIFHQASESFVPTSITQPSHVVENNCVSTVNLLEAATKEDKGIKGIQLACSSEQYGFVKDINELPVKETNELRPTGKKQ